MEGSGAKIVADYLVARGVKYVYGVPGAKIDPLLDALIDTPIELIVCHHEQNAAFMAAMEGRLTGRPGVVLATSGPGISNLITGLLTATTEGDPLIAIGGAVPLSMRLKESHQAAHNVPLTTPATKLSVEVTDVNTLTEVFENAFRVAQEPKAGATFVSLPQNILQETTTYEMPRLGKRAKNGGASKHSIEECCRAIQHAKIPVLLLGMEASRVENVVAIRALLEQTPLPVVSTYQAAGVISHKLLPCFVGRVGLFKNQPGDRLLEVADLIVTVGFSSVEYDPETWNVRGLKELIHINYTPATIHALYQPKIEAIGEISPTIEQIKQGLKPSTTLPSAPLIQELQDELWHKIEPPNQTGNKVHPLHFIHDLRALINDETIVACDIGTHYMWLARHLLSYEPHHLLFSNGQQTLGVALPWAMVAKLLYPDHQVISVSGDGGFYFSAMELETAVRLGLDFVHCIFCDGYYDMVKQQQLMKYDRACMVEIGSLDHVQFAKSCGATGLRVSHPDDLRKTLEEGFSTKGPTLIEIPIDYSQNQELFTTVMTSVGH